MLYISTLQKAYDEYCKQVPLDLEKGTKVQLDVWKGVIRYALPEYARKVAALAHSLSLDEFVTHSGGDFDNLAPVIKTAVSHSLLTISLKGKVASKQLPFITEGFGVDNDNLDPYAEYNQFPCDSESSDFRARFILNRYPYRKNIHIGLIGDDDFISLRLMKDSATKVSVLEKDTRIIDKISKCKTTHDDIDIYELDIRDVVPSIGLDTFVTDPPYTFDGSLAFIVCGFQ